MLRYMNDDNETNDNEPTIAAMVRKVFVSVTGEEGAGAMRFTLANGDSYVFYHEQDCCEWVAIEEIIGDLSDLVGVPLLEAEEVSSAGFVCDSPKPRKDFNDEDPGVGTWTFYKFGTIKGFVTVRWLGQSNGYYSEEVSLRYDRGRK